MKKLSLFVMVLLAITLLSVGVLATIDSVVITQPLANDILHGTAVEFNGTFTATGAVTDSDLNVSIYMGQIGSLQGQRVCNNATLDLVGLTWACKVDMNALNDNASMSFNITVGNQTGAGGGATQQSSAQVTGIQNDDQAPTAIFRRQELNARSQQTFYADCSDSTDNLDGSLTYQINLVKPGGNNASTVITSATGTFSGSDVDQIGAYTLSCTVLDNAPLTTYKGSAAIANPASANSNSATQTITVSSGGTAQILAQTTQQPSAPTAIVPLMLVAGAVVAGILFFKK